jgi:hypothetical protein
MKETLMNRISRALTLLFLAATVSSVAVAADWEPKVIDRWEINVGSYLTGIDTTIRLDVDEDFLGTPIDFEQDLDFDDSAVLPRFSVALLLGKRHQFRLGYYQLDREASGRVEEEFRWGDLIFPIDVGYRGSVDVKFIEASYTLYFVANEKTAVGGILGLVYLDASASLELDAFGIGLDGGADYQTDLPVPQIGLTLRQMLPVRFVLSGTATFLRINNISEVSGDTWNANIALEHRTFKNFGFGAAYTVTSLGVESEREDFPGKLDFEISGFQFYLRFGF